MKRPKQSKTPRVWKRKREWILEKRLRQHDQRLRTAPERERFSRLTRNVMTPVLLAETARRLGSPAVEPRDFFCGCLPCAKDGLPICQQVKPDCRFKNRWSEESAAATETGHVLNTYEYAWESVCIIYSGDRTSVKFGVAIDQAEARQ